ncbi:MAG: nuclear transport factor 2 family protein [Pseudomonadota bacterium]
MKLIKILAIALFSAAYLTTASAANSRAKVIYEGNKARAVEAVLSAANSKTVDIRRVIEDGNFVVTHGRYLSDNDATLGFEIFKFEGDKIVDRASNFQKDTGVNPSGRTGLDGPYIVGDLDKTESNKRLVESYFSDAFLKGDFSNFETYFDGDHYIQHNLAIPDGISALFAYITDLADNGVTVKFEKIVKVVAEGNFVLIVSEAVYGDQPTSFYDLYHVVNGKIAEHWDVIGPLRE